MMPTRAPSEMTRTAATLLAAMSAIASYTVAPGATEQISCPLFLRTEPIEASTIDFFLPLRIQHASVAAWLRWWRCRRAAARFIFFPCLPDLTGSLSSPVFYFGLGYSNAIWNRTDQAG